MVELDKRSDGESGVQIAVPRHELVRSPTGDRYVLGSDMQHLWESSQGSGAQKTHRIAASGGNSAVPGSQASLS